MIQNSRVVAAQSVINESRMELEEGEQDPQQVEEVGKSRVTKQVEMSLTMLNAQKGEISLPQSQPKPQTKQVRRPSRSWLDWLKRKEVPTPKQEDKSQFLPCPKIVKISDAIYGVYNANCLNIYRYHPSGGTKNSKKKIFAPIGERTLKSNIVFVRGYRNMILVSMVNEFKVYLVEKNGSLDAELTFSDPESQIIGGGIDIEGIVIFTRNRFKKFKVESSEIKLIEQTIFYVSVQDVKFIEVFKGESDNYFFVFSERKKVTFSSESERHLTETEQSDVKQIERQGQVFNIIQIERTGENSHYSCYHYQIAKIPEQGMFDNTKVFYLGNKTFLVSLHEQIVLIRKQYSRYIIVDNICITSNRLTEESTTGQLVLIDKSNIIYSENERIYVCTLVFDKDIDKLKLVPVDNFKGVDEAQIILYDGILLTPKNTTIQVLFYFNSKKVRRPGRLKSTGQDPMDFSEKDEGNKLKFSVYGIVQLKPVVKLVELLQAKRPAQEIQEFRNRFQIKPLEYYKSQWSVSGKSLNDIVTNLLEINDEGFIQKELDHVLRKETHTLGFLLKIEEKQIVRLRVALTAKLEQQAPETLVVEAIQRLLESKMFEKKLKYQNEFEAYKEVDFIDIKKLRETSLREEIKLLSCKGFERRLKRFLNEFKYLAIANFEDIFQFLMANKDQNDIQQFFGNFSFIFPQAVEKSIVNCFIQAGEGIRKKEINDMDECTLWEGIGVMKGQQHALALPSEKTITETDRPETLQTFVLDIFPNQTAKNAQQIRRLRVILEEFKESDWFKEGAFKKHCMLFIDKQQLFKKCVDLKSHRAYDILFKFLYERIEDSFQREAIIDGLIADGRISPSYRANINIRVEVFHLLSKLSPSEMREITLPDFIIYSEPKFFSFLVQLSQTVRVSNKENLIMTIVKQLFLNKVSDKGFFEERINVYLLSNSIHIGILKALLEQFRDLGAEFQQENQELLSLLIKSSMKNLTIGDFNDAKEILKTLSEIDLYQEYPNPEMCAKMMQGFLFREFFNCFSLEYTYEQFSELTHVNENNKLFKEIIEKYCKEQYNSTFFKYNPSQLEENKSQLSTIKFQKPIDFLYVLKNIVQEVGFQISLCHLIQMFLLGMFMEERYPEVQEMSQNLFGLISEGEDQEEERTPRQAKKDPKLFLQELILKHVDNAYHSGSSMETVFKQVSESLDLVDPQTISTKQKRAFLELSLEISRLQYGIQTKFNIEKEQSYKPMVFLIHLLEALDKQVLMKVSNPDLQEAFQIIYEKVSEATNVDIGFKANAKQSTQFQEFQVQRGYYYLKNGEIHKAIEVCEQFSEQADLYYHDLIYGIVVQICRQHKFTPATRQAFSVLIQYTINNSGFDVNTQKLVVTECLKELCGMDQNSQIAYMKELAGLMKEKPTRLILGERSLLDELMKGVIEHTLGYKVDESENEVYYAVFMQLLRHNPIEAFYFLMKNPVMSIHRVMSTLQNKHDDSFKRDFIAKYFTLAIYIRSLRQVTENFYPTYSFFQHKENHLDEDKTRRDINILAEKLSINEMKNPQQPKISEILMKYYDMYLQGKNMRAEIDLAEVSIREDVQPEIVEEKQRKIDKNQLKLRQQLLETQAKFDALTSNLQTRLPAVFDSPAPALQTTPLPSLRLNQLKTPDLPSKTYEKYEDVKSRQITALRKMEETNMETARAETKYEVDKIIEKFKLQRVEKMSYTKSREPSEPESIKQTKKRSQDMFDGSTPPLFTPTTYRRGSRPQQFSRVVQFQTHLPQKAEKPYQEMVRRGGPPLTERPGKPQLNKSLFWDGKEQSIASSSINFIRKKIDQNRMKMATGGSLIRTLEEHKAYLQRVSEKEVLEYLSKMEMIKGNQVLSGEFVKKMFDNCRNFVNFLKTLEVILKHFEHFDQLYERKSLRIATQAIRIDSKIDPKKLFELKFFQNPVPNIEQDQFYRIAFKRIKPNIVKLLDQQNVHTLPKMMMYGLGMDKKYEHRVYKLYLSAKLDDYIGRNYSEKEIIALLEKIKSVFAKVPAEKMSKLLLKKKTIDSKKIIDLVQRLEESLNRTMKVHVSMVSPQDRKLLELMKSL